MVLLDANEIVERYERFMGLIEKDERSEQLIKMYETRWPQQLVEAPASDRPHFHNAFPGGYLDHILTVYDCSVKIAKMYYDLGGNIDFTPQELRFAALHHDLGKLGQNDQEPYYVDQDSDWHRNKLGQMYKFNEIQYMDTAERGLSILHEEGIPITQKEWLGIRLADGMFKEANKSYLKNSMYPYPMRTQLPWIIHQADYMATTFERERAHFGG